ncbi:ribosome biogenesis GTPase RsgA [Enterobacter cloacae]|uniref:Ribosome biogenesis GTPase RsgA n=1 Tax=Enterobacter cloacae TaxID=550 RepID=A0A377M8I6_ENTCL|nr:ribosome biogenesis GTPase RsgA [Enterobacter cloacae]
MNANHQRRLKTTSEKVDYDDNLFGEPTEGVVISRFGMHATWNPPTVRSTVAIFDGLSVRWLPAIALSGVQVKSGRKA